MTPHQPFRVAFALVLAAILSIPAPSAAMHPASFPHKHFRRTAPPPPVPRPRREKEILVSYDSGLSLSVGGGGHFVLGDGEPSSITSGLGYGAGFDLCLGWRFSKHTGLDLTWTSSFHQGSPQMSFNHAMFSELAALLRIIFVADPSFMEPYAQVGVGLNLLSRDGDTRTSLVGPGFVAGAGIDFHLNETVTLGVRTLYRGSYLESGQQNSAIDGSPSHESTVLNTVSMSGYLALGF